MEVAKRFNTHAELHQHDEHHFNTHAGELEFLDGVTRQNEWEDVLNANDHYGHASDGSSDAAVAGQISLHMHTRPLHSATASDRFFAECMHRVCLLASTAHYIALDRAACIRDGVLPRRCRNAIGLTTTLLSFNSANDCAPIFRYLPLCTSLRYTPAKPPENLNAHCLQRGLCHSKVLCMSQTS